MQHSTLPSYVRDLLSACPSSGDGVHNWLFRCARVLHPHHPEGAIIRLLEAASSNCGRAVQQREIAEAVRNSAACAPSNGRYTRRRTPSPCKWPSPSRDVIDSICASGPGVADLWESSPIAIHDNHSHTEDIIDVLFPDNPWLCCARTQAHFATRSREDWRGTMEHMQFIVPNPMNDKLGTTKTGKTSQRTLANTAPRRFLVIEFDQGTFDQQAALLWHLGSKAPLVLVVMSGGKSLHGWFYVHNKPEERQHRFMRYAVSLGADRATWTPVQLVRMPDGIRENGQRQAVIFFNPKRLGK